MWNPLPTLTGVAAGAILTAGACVAGTATADEGWNPPPRAEFMRTQCPAEDSLNCAWNARTDGNGIGVSFYAKRERLLGERGHRIGTVACHFLVRPKADRRYSSCQVIKRTEAGH